MSSASQGQITDSTPPLPTGPLPRINSSAKKFRPTDIQNFISIIFKFNKGVV